MVGFVSLRMAQGLRDCAGRLPVRLGEHAPANYMCNCDECSATIVFLFPSSKIAS